MAKIFYRVGKEDCSGLWYNQKGEFHGLMYSLDLSNKNLQMPFDKDIAGWLSATESLEELKNWFSDYDMGVLEPLGYKVLTYSAEDYKIHNGHYVINQETSKLI